MKRHFVMLRIFIKILCLLANGVSGENSTSVQHSFENTTQVFCGGNFSSPIDLPRSGIPNVEMPPLVFKFYEVAPETMVLINNGHTAKIVTKAFKPEVSPVLSGADLAHEYKFSHLTIHWGSTNSLGSEHTKSNVTFPVEVQMVHFKSNFSSFEDAMMSGSMLEDDPTNIVALASFFQIVLPSNGALTNLLDGMELVVDAGTEAIITSFPISVLLPEERDSFTRYNGSLTEHDCSASAQWFILQDTVHVSLEQLTRFRKMKAEDGQLLVDNVRPKAYRRGRPIFHVQTTDSGISGSCTNSPPAVVSASGLLLVMLAFC